MKLHQLRDLIAVSERGSLRAAARHLRVAQPAITRSIHALERELGVPLFERHTRGMLLTPLGNLLRSRAEVVLGEVRRAQEEIEQRRNNMSGTITVGLSIAPHIALLPQALKAFRKRFPGVVVNLIEGFFPTVEQQVKEGTVDFYVGPAPSAPLSPELKLEPLFENNRIVLGRRGHALAKARSLSELAGAEWITTSITHRAEEELNAVFSERGLAPPKLAMRTQSALSLMLALANTDLLAMVPVQWVGFEPIRHSLSRIDLEDVLRAPPIVVVQRASLPLTPAADYFNDLLRRAAAPYAAGLTARAKRRTLVSRRA
jgi:LysR family transcriptional regulator, regulator of abg operon